jgi:hypothetical protein
MGFQLMESMNLKYNCYVFKSMLGWGMSEITEILGG